MGRRFVSSLVLLLAAVAIHGTRAVDLETAENDVKPANQQDGAVRILEEIQEEEEEEIPLPPSHMPSDFPSMMPSETPLACIAEKGGDCTARPCCFAEGLTCENIRGVCVEDETDRKRFAHEAFDAFYDKDARESRGNRLLRN